MKQLERVNLIDKIAYDLQEKMKFINIKSYFGGFDINCINHVPKYNSKRVFVQEVLANETSEVISKIADNLGLLKHDVNNKNIEVFVLKKFDECITEDNEEFVANYLPFYSEVKDERLRYLFAYLDCSFNSLFQFLNDKIQVNYEGHYNTHESKELLNIIELKNKFQQVFENTEYAFVMDREYLTVIEKCNQFLVKSGGSKIPSTFNKIDIIEDRPIFSFTNLSERNQKDEAVVIKKQNIIKTETNKLKNKVFIVHGHDNAVKQEIARFIAQIGLQAIILHEQASMSMTIIEKIEHYSNEANFAIILYTPCDKGRGALEINIHPRDRARQNVVFEHGYLMARLGRKNVCALVKGEIETPSDIDGVVYTPLDSFGGWKHTLSVELRACDYELKSI